MTERQKLEGWQALMMLKGVMLDKGAEFVYEKRPNQDDEYAACMNFEADNSPSCIVGHVLDRLGVSGEWVRVGGLNISGVRIVAEHLEHADGFDWNLSPLAINVLATAQDWQDIGWSWGVAVAKAQEALEAGHQVYCDVLPPECGPDAE